MAERKDVKLLSLINTSICRTILIEYLLNSGKIFHTIKGARKIAI